MEKGWQSPCHCSLSHTSALTLQPEYHGNPLDEIKYVGTYFGLVASKASGTVYLVRINYSITLPRKYHSNIAISGWIHSKD